ncbi:MAG: ROK family protein, partial [Coriobacteriia bacterium]|nr:ROK family protein [Coriobacteriia bacterium]
MRIVFDIGGTSFRYAKYVDGEMVAGAKEPTPNYLQGHAPEEINQLLLEGIGQAIGSDLSRITEVGICYAGPVSGQGRILGSPTIHGIKLEHPFDLRAAVQSLAGIRDVWVINDLSAAAYRYIDDYRSFELITVSTSVGNKIVIDGQLQLGSDGLEGELGHQPACLPSPFEGLITVECTCGTGTNHIGAISSGRGIAEVAQQLCSASLKESYLCSPFKGRDSFTTEEITAAAAHGDEFSQSVLDICTYPLAYALCLTLTSLYLEKVILIGGVVLNSPSYFDSLMSNIMKIGVYNYSAKHLKDKITL